MSDFSFLAIPNIEGMRLWWYIQIFGIVILFGVCLFFVLYFLLKYRRRKALVHQLDDFDHQAQDLGKQLLAQKIHTSSGKTKLILFIEYLEKFVTTQSYATLSHLLISQWCTQKEAEEFSEVLYTDKKFSQHLEIRLQSMIDTF